MPKSASSPGTISVAFVNEAVASLARRGVDAGPILRGARIPLKLLASSESRISAEAFGRFWLAVAAALDDEFFGLDSRPMRVGSFATLCQLMLHTRNLRQALRRAARFINLLIDDTRIEIDLGGGEAAVRFVEKRNIDAEGKVFAHETLFVMLHGLVCWLVGRRVVISSAELAYPQPVWHREYLQIIGEHLAFDCQVTRFAFDPLDLRLPIVQSEQTAKAFLQNAPQSFVVKYKNPHSASARVRRRLRQLAPEQWPTFEALARELHLSPTTLRRQLERDGASYRSEKNARRRELALQYLADPQRSVLDVAHALGFAEPSAFHRAFRQWTGGSPGDYRPRRLTEEA